MLWFLVKVFIFLFCFIWLRGTLPRLRYDQFMALGWKVLIPVTWSGSWSSRPIRALAAGTAAAPGLYRRRSAVVAAARPG